MDVQGAVIDLDGTVYRGDHPVPGAVAAVTRLRERGIGTLFVTNNPTRSRQTYVERLAEFGIEASPAEVLSAGTVTAEFLADRHADDAVFLVGSRGLREQLHDHDVETVADPGAADVVVTSYTLDFDYESLTEGLWAVDEADAFYGSDPDLTYPHSDGKRYPGSGAITRAVAGVAQREPDLVLGKPSGAMVEQALATLDCHPAECVVIGDGLDTDVAFAVRAGMRSVLVLSGRTTRAEVEAASAQPDRVVDSLADVPDVLDLLE